MLVQRNTRIRKNRFAVVVLTTLTAALLALAAVPAFASATVFVVDGTEDGQTQEACEMLVTGECTLRGAIEAVDAGSGADRIEFSTAVFTGLPPFTGDDITLTSELPPIEKRTTILGQVFDNGVYDTHAVGVIAPAGSAGLTVEADDVTVQGIAFQGGKYGIDVTNSSTGTRVIGDWFGLKLDTTAAPITSAGVLLGPGSDGAEIGEGNGAGINVFGNAEYGIDLEGASQTKVVGNYIGVEPIGFSGSGLSEGVRITDAPGSPATNNEIGGERVSPVGFPHCGGACNVIVASRRGIDLTGDANLGLGSATGPTTIRGNYIGLSAFGEALARFSGSFGIWAIEPENGTGSEPGPGQVTVGGPSASEGNVIDNGGLGMVAGESDGLLVQGNLVGWLPVSESAGSDPEQVAFVVSDEGVSVAPEVLENEMHLGPNAVGIESFGPGARIVGNRIFGSETGVLTADEDAGKGNLIAENLIEGANLYGVLIQNDFNTVTGNTIVGAGRNGVITDREQAPEPYPVANRIGGDSPALENLIDESGESAISFGGEPEATNEALGNFGFGNGGPFITLREHHTGHPPNGEIKPPVLEVVRQSSVSGSAVPGAKVRVFGKPSTVPGSLERQIASAIADASGHWTVTFTTKLAVGKLVAATQTTAAGTPSGATSEVSAPTAAEADPNEEVSCGLCGGGTPVGGGGTGSSNAGTPNAPAVSPAPVKPKVKVVSGPKKSSKSTMAKFTFKATNVAGAKFECKLDGAKWASCKSPRTYKKLKVGKHTFQVRAKAGGLTGAVVKFKFTVVAAT